MEVTKKAGFDEAGTLGSVALPGNRCAFRVWAPMARRIEVELLEGQPRRLVLQRSERGMHHGIVEGVGVGARYRFVLEGSMALPDPASRSQPDGVHGPSEVIATDFDWSDEGWCNRPLSQYAIYELHVGTFTSSGTFAAVIDELDRLVELGITAVELMPIAQFPGSRNWGYDGVYPFAVQRSYGGAFELKRLVDACHRRNLAVVLDVVYNHLGPEGNYLRRFAPFFTDVYRTPWGDALNFDGPGSDGVRRFFVENALMWFEEFHIDGLRLDAVHAIVDRSPYPFLTELAETVAELSRRTHWPRYLIAESNANDPRLVRSIEQGGHGLDAVWADDFHHALHVLATGERDGYYADYLQPDALVMAWRSGFTYTGQYSKVHDRRHGASSHGISAERFVVCAQNHDQVGNRPQGERLSVLVDRAKLRWAAALVMCSRHTPLLFMGEEYGERRPFLYFTSHGSAELAAAVREGRLRELGGQLAAGEIADPQDVDTFARSVLDRGARREPSARHLEELYRRLLALRRDPRFCGGPEQCQLVHDGRVLWIDRGHPIEMSIIFVLGDCSVHIEVPDVGWEPLLDSREGDIGGEGNAIHRSGIGRTRQTVLPGHGFLVLGRRAVARAEGETE